MYCFTCLCLKTKPKEELNKMSSKCHFCLRMNSLGEKVFTHVCPEHAYKVCRDEYLETTVPTTDADKNEYDNELPLDRPNDNIYESETELNTNKKSEKCDSENDSDDQLICIPEQVEHRPVDFNDKLGRMFEGDSYDDSIHVQEKDFFTSNADKEVFSFPGKEQKEIMAAAGIAFNFTRDIIMEDSIDILLEQNEWIDDTIVTVFIIYLNIKYFCANKIDPFDKSTSFYDCDETLIIYTYFWGDLNFVLSLL